MRANENFQRIARSGTSETFYLLDIVIAGANYRFATRDVNVVDGSFEYAYKGYINTISDLKQQMRISPLMIEASISNMTVRLSPEAKLRNALDSWVLDGQLVYVRKWLEGLAFDDAILMVKGKIRSFTVNADHTESFTIENWESDLQAPIHPVQVNETLWTAAQEDAIEKPYPVLYGDMVNTICPQVVIGNPSKFLIAGHALDATNITSMIVGNNDKYWENNKFKNPGATPTAAHTTDIKGNVVTLLSYGSDLDDFIITVTCEGKRDTPTGRYTGTPNGKIDHPFDAVMDCLVEYCDYVYPDDIDTQQFLKARGERPNFKISAALSNQKTRINFINQLLYQCTSIGYTGADGYKIVPINLDATPSIYFEDGKNIFAMSYQEGKQNMVAHDFIVNYAFKDVNSQFTKKKIASASDIHGDEYLNESCKAAKTKYGFRKTITINADYIRDDVAAQNLLDHLVEFFTKLRLQAKITTTWEYSYLELGDIIGVTHSIGPGNGWDQKKFLITGLSFGKEVINIDCLEV